MTDNRIDDLLADLESWASDGDEIAVKHAVHARRFREAHERVDRIVSELEGTIKSTVALLGQHLQHPEGSRDDFVEMLHDRLTRDWQLSDD